MTARTPTPVYKVGTQPGQWQPTPPDYSIAWGPAWGQVTPFAIPSGQRLPAPPPPALNSPEYTAAYNEVMSLGAANSTTRTAERDPDRQLLGLRFQGLRPTCGALQPGHRNTGPPAA